MKTSPKPKETKSILEGLRKVIVASNCNDQKKQAADFVHADLRAQLPPHLLALYDAHYKTG